MLAEAGATNKTLIGEAGSWTEAVTLGFVTEVAVTVTVLGNEKLAGAVNVTDVEVGFVRLPKSSGVTLHVTPAL